MNFAFVLCLPYSSFVLENAPLAPMVLLLWTEQLHLLNELVPCFSPSVLLSMRESTDLNVKVYLSVSLSIRLHTYQPAYLIYHSFYHSVFLSCGFSFFLSVFLSVSTYRSYLNAFHLFNLATGIYAYHSPCRGQNIWSQKFCFDSGRSQIGWSTAVVWLELEVFKAAVTVSNTVGTKSIDACHCHKTRNPPTSPFFWCMS